MTRSKYGRQLAEISIAGQKSPWKPHYDLSVILKGRKKEKQDRPE
jgi:hypothetical protein